MSKKINVAVIGASGYTGVELLKMIAVHPNFELTYVATSEGETTLSALHPALMDVLEIDVSKASAQDVARYADLAFLALPHQTAMGFVKELMELDVKVVDLSADYRLKLETYEANYCPHIDTKNLEHAVYGIAEMNREEIKNARLVANPGCYPTATILAALPFMQYRIKDSSIIVDAKSGVSGAGKKLATTTHYVSINENIHAYGPLGHRHESEIEEKLEVGAGKIDFVPHLIPLTRGMLNSTYMQVEGDFDPIELLRAYYKDEKFVRIRETPVDVKSVAGTHFCDIYAKRRGNTLFLSSAIDNILRGASSAAMLNANLMMGLPEHTAIPFIAYVP